MQVLIHLFDEVIFILERYIPYAEDAPGTNSPVDRAAQGIEAYLQFAHDQEGRLLHDKQIDVMQDLHRFLQTHGDEPHGYISLPTGVGKTVLFTELAKATDLRTLVLMPTRGLLDQTEQAFQRFGDEIAVGKVFSGEQNARERITLSTYASFVRHTKKGSRHIAPGNFDLIILDEAHRALGDETHHALAKYNDAIQIGFTATEDYSEQRRLQTLLPTEIHKMTIKEAIEHRLISPFLNTVVKTGVDVSSVRITQTNEYDTADLEEALNTGNRNSIAVRLYLAHFNRKKAVVFCNGVEHAKAVAEMFEEAGVSAKALHGKLPLREQVEAKDAFADTGPYAIDVITNDKLLAEGFDVPAASVCLNLAPTLSRVRAQQRGGRVLRLDADDPDKVAYIVDFIDEAYQKPPVLFADPRIGETANVGTEKTELPEATDNVQDVEIITDPTTVTAMAERFYEQHKIKREYAPDGWLSASQICAIYHLRGVNVYNVASELERKKPLQSRKFHSPFIRGRTQRTYYSPEIVRELVEQQGLEYVDFVNTVPIGWINRKQVEANYPPRVLKTVYDHTRHLNDTMWADQVITVGDSEYYGPGLQAAIEKNTIPGKHWCSVEPLMDKYGSDETEIERVIQLLAKKEKKLSGIYPLWCFVNGRETLYAFPIAYDYIESELIAIRRGDNVPKKLTEGEVVTFHQKPSTRELARIFAEDDAKLAHTSEAKRKRELDALYAEFQ